MSKYIKTGLNDNNKLNAILTDEIKVTEAVKTLITTHTGSLDTTNSSTVLNGFQKSIERIVSDRIDNLDTPVDEIERISRNKPEHLRNVVLSGRVKDGLPAYLTTHEFLNTEHEWADSLGVHGSVTTSSNYSTDYTGVRALSNQIVPTTYYWGTTNGTKTGWWEYTFKIPRIITGLFYTCQNTEYSPGEYQIQGWDGTNWIDLYKCTRKRRVLGDAGNTKEFGRMLWFTHNTTAYSKIRFNVGSVAGTGPWIDIKVIRFFESVHDDLSPDECVLKASVTEPFVASIACGKSEDRTVGITSDVVIPGTLLNEMSRNYCYLVPEDTNGNCPAYVNNNRAIKLPGSPTYLVMDSRKVHYCTEAALKKQCQMLLQCTELTDRTLTANEIVTYQGSQGETSRKIIANGITIKADKKHRGSQAAYNFTTDTSCVAVDRATQHTSFKDPIAQNQPGLRDFTVECDLMYYDTPQATEDTNRVIFTSGAANSNNGFWVFYNHRSGQIKIWINNQWIYAIPYVFDTQWHHLSITRTNAKLFVHVDGVCIGFYNACPAIKTFDSPYGFGINSGYGQSSWKGSMANLRYIIGHCAYQNETYVVSPMHKSYPIMNNTLWWNPDIKVVQQWDSTNEKWVDTPMLPIGHVDTVYRRHLHSETPLGTNAVKQDLYHVKNITASGTYDGNYPAVSIFNFYSNNDYPYLTPNNNTTTTHYVRIDLYEPLAFDELRFAPRTDWITDPCVFTWEGSNDDGVTWTMLIDRSVYIRDGSISLSQHYLGITHHINGMKRLKYNEATKFSSYRLTFLPKSTIPYHSSVAYTQCRLQLPLKDSTPEINSITSYVIGDVFTYGPMMISINTEYTLPAPFGGVPFEVDGCVLEKSDFTTKKRPLGAFAGYYASGHYNSGEIVYPDDNNVVVMTGNYATTLYTGTVYNSKTIAAMSTFGDMTMICRRKL